MGAIHTAWTRPELPHSYGLDLIASEATLALTLGAGEFRLRGQAGGEPVDVTTVDPFAVSVRRFLDAVRAGDPSRVACPPADALGTLRVAVACELALASGETVAVADGG